MDSQICLLLLQDGLTTGAIYLLLAIGLLLVFSVTRIIFIPQGEFVAYGALTLAALENGQIPGTLWLLDLVSLAAAAFSVYAAIRTRNWHRLGRALFIELVYPALLTLLVVFSTPAKPWAQLNMVLTIAIVAPMGPMLYRFAYQRLANSSELTLLILSMAIHFVMLGMGLVLFGPEGSRTPALSNQIFTVDGVDISGQSLWILGCCLALVAALRWFFAFSIYGKALRAAASDQLGARLMGIDQATTGKLSFFFAAFVGAVAGILIGPITPIYYDTGFAIGLKGFVAAIIGGLVSYPVAAIGALIVGVLESFSTFWTSTYSQVIVFTSLIPVLVWLSFTRRVGEKDK